MVDVVELPPIEYNPWLPEIHADPYPMYRRLREEDPVHSSLPGVYIVSRHQDVSWLLRDPKFSHDNRKSALYPMFIESLAPEERSFVEERMGQNMLFTDPPDHTRLRGLVSKAFGTRVIEALRPRVEQIVTELLDELIGAGPVDLVERFAYPVPVTVICELMGVPQEDRHLFHRWSADLVLTLDPLITPAVLRRASASSIAFDAYFTELLAERRKHPRENDLLTGLLAAEQEGDRLTYRELLSTAILLLVAGHETTVNLISNGMLALIRHPDQMQRLREDPSLLRTAVEELLRYDSPVQIDGRTVLEDMEIGGVPIAAGQQVVGLLGAANRDPAQFDRPDELDIGREDNRHLAFGAGIHFCLGSPLARAEGQVAIRELVRRTARIELASEADLRWRETITLRGLSSLLVTLSA